MTILCLTGWQQRVDALAGVVPNALHFDYGAYDNVKTMFAALPQSVSLAVGWSLGGQLLVRAVAESYIRPKALLLLGAPFQCVADEKFPHGMSAAMLGEFRNNYIHHPQETLKQFNALMGLADAYASSVIHILNKEPVIWNKGLLWLNELGNFSCNKLDFSGFLDTTIVHGENDKVIDPANAKTLASHIPNAQLMLWSQCGHVPHLHNPDALKRIIKTYV